jgi:hypothetical protein|tara:strand:+ start:23 stop:361 length:339 start_codon:yes stop_codon:yes gene_type:complete
MSKLQVDDIVNKDDDGCPSFSKGAVISGVATATTFKGALTGNVTGDVTGNADSATTATTATNAQGLTGTPSVVVGVATANSFSIGVGGTDVLTAINTKATTGKAIAMSMVFG